MQRPISLRGLWKDCRGQDAMEYALASGIVAIGCMVAMEVWCGLLNTVFFRLGSIVVEAIR